MTTSQIVPSIAYIGNGATTVFSYPFELTNENYLDVALIELATLETTALVLDVDYSIDMNAGEVTYPLVGSPMSSSFMLNLLRQEPYSQAVSFSTQGNFDPDTLEAALDALSLQIQQVYNFVRWNGVGPRMKVYTLATLPSVTNGAPLLIYVQDASGGGIPCFSDGTNWRRVDDREIVS